MNKKVYDLYQQQLLKLKPLLVISDKNSINELTKYAADCIESASTIVQVIYNNWSGELGFLYLIDSIIKNVKKQYVKEFGKDIRNQLLKHSSAMDLEKVYRLLITWHMFKLAELPLEDCLYNLFKKQVMELSGNDKLIITNLTKSAHCCIERGDVIVKVLYERINLAEDKLSHLYLIDSILKNCKGKYLIFFKDLDKMTIHLFRQNPNLRPKILKLVETWQDLFDLKFMNGLKHELIVYNQNDTCKKLDSLILAKDKLPKTKTLVQELLVLQKLLHVLKTKQVDQQTLVQIEQKILELKITPKVELSQDSINNTECDDLFPLLYPQNDHQCKQCALRYESKTKLQEHLDWHFRQNKVKKENKVVLSRDWYPSLEDWFQEVPMDKDQGNNCNRRRSKLFPDY